MVAVTEAVYFLAMSRHVAQHVGNTKSAAPAPSARKIIAATRFALSAAARVNAAEAAIPTLPTARRPHLTPILVTIKSPAKPPMKLPRAPAKKGRAERKIISLSWNPRPLTRYVLSQDR